MLTLLMNRSDTVDLYVKWIVMLSTFLFHRNKKTLREEAHLYYGGIKPLANYSLMNKSETKKYVLLVKMVNS